jgi:hypothetical protein
MKPFPIFIGFDPKEAVAFHVLAHSILRRSSIPVSITPLVRSQLGSVYTRPRGATESTEFSMTRFLVPKLCNYEGYALFLDCDMLFQADVAEMYLSLAMDMGLDGLPKKAVYVCQHDYTPKEATKFLGQVQTSYPRKNWSSVMLFNNALCKALTPEYVNTATGLDLHRLNWTSDELIGSLPLVWNHLVGEYPVTEGVKNVHFTIGGPYFPEYEGCDYSAEWFAERNHMLGKA